MRISKRSSCICGSVLWLMGAVAPALPATRDFNGSWDITVQDEKHGRAWWLKIEGAGTPHAKGDFVSAFDGNLNPIEEISIEGNKLVFGFRPKSRKPGGENRTRHLVYSAELSNNMLHGTFCVEGQPDSLLHWTGVRAPAISDRDNGSWHEGTAIELFDGRSLAGWHLQETSRTNGWFVKDGILTSTGKVSDLVSDRKFWNFQLHAEFKVPEGSNSGIGLRARYEVQIKGDYGKTPDTHSSGALYSRIVPTRNAIKPAGEWQTYDIRLVGREVTIAVNGTTIIDKGFIEGLTAMATDPNEGKPGPISLQGDHGAVEFRHLTITPLEKK
jgi:hypothetical protein